MRRQPGGIEHLAGPYPEQGDVFLDTVHGGEPAKGGRPYPAMRGMLVVEFDCATKIAQMKKVDFVDPTVKGIPHRTHAAQFFHLQVRSCFLAQFAKGACAGRFRRFDMTRGESPQPRSQRAIIRAFQEQEFAQTVLHEADRKTCLGRRHGIAFRA